MAAIVCTVAGDAPISGGYSGGGGAVSAGRNFASSSFGSSSGSGINEYVDEG